MKQPRKLKVAMWLLLLLLCALLLEGLLRPGLWPMPPDNGYETFLQATVLLPDESPDYGNPTALAAFVSESDEAYSLVQQGLKRPCLVSVKASKRWASQHQEVDVPRLKHLTHAMIAKARLAELAGQPDTAYEAYVDAFRFADAIGRGGLSLDFLNSVACRSLVLDHSQSLVPLLSAEQRTGFSDLIKRSATLRENAIATERRSARWRWSTYGLGYWWGLITKVYETRSLGPFQNERGILLGREATYTYAYEKPTLERLQNDVDLKDSSTELGGPANGSQPIRSETNSTSAAAGSRR